MYTFLLTIEIDEKLGAWAFVMYCDNLLLASSDA